MIFALFAGGIIGAVRIVDLERTLTDTTVPAAKVVVNLVVSILSVGAPVWFAWLSTKQIGQRFRLAEDYAFKASVSRAYEGYRREAARVDKDMEAKLLASALSRLDELPLRLIETSTHGSPLHELLSSNAVKQALRGVPGFTDQVRELAIKTVEAAAAKQPGRRTPKPAPEAD